MNDRTRTTLRVLAGGYLAYIGFNLIKKLLADRPDNIVPFMIVGILFFSIGIVLCVRSVIHYVKNDYIHKPDDKVSGDREESAIDDSNLDNQDKKESGDEKENEE